MPLEPLSEEVADEVRAWLTKAVHDLRAAGYLAHAEHPLLDIAVYHCQQAVEKALEGFLTAASRPFPKTHALIPLVELAMEVDASFEGLRDPAEALSPFAWRFRYPGDVLEPSEAEAREALELARRALDFVLERLQAEALPD